MSNWVEYWDKDRQLMIIVGSYVPREGDWIKVKLRDKFKLRKVRKVEHLLDKTDNIKEKFRVSIL